MGVGGRATGGDGATYGQGGGGGICIEDSAVTIENCVVAGNLALTSDDDVFGPFNP